MYKRRESLSQLETLEWIVQGTPFPKATQIGNEIDYFFDYYGTLKPKVFLSYEREAFYALDGSDFRVTLMSRFLPDRRSFRCRAKFGESRCSMTSRS